MTYFCLCLCFDCFLLYLWFLNWTIVTVPNGYDFCHYLLAQLGGHTVFVVLSYVLNELINYYYYYHYMVFDKWYRINVASQSWIRTRHVNKGMIDDVILGIRYRFHKSTKRRSSRRTFILMRIKLCLTCSLYLVSRFAQSFLSKSIQRARCILG